MLRRVILLLIASQLAFARGDTTSYFPETALRPAPVSWMPTNPLELCRGVDCPAPKMRGLFPLPWWSLLAPSWDTLLHQSSLEPDVVPVPMRGCTAQVDLGFLRICIRSNIFRIGIIVQGPQIESCRISSQYIHK